MYILAPSILSADVCELGNQIEAARRGGAEYIHIDVMDGHFVRSLSFGVPVVRSLRKCTKLVFDVHLMVEKPLHFIDLFADAGADLISFHVEAEDDPDRVIEAIRSRGKKVGICLNPATPAERILPYIDRVDQITVMCVDPGLGGQEFNPEVLDKIRELRAELTKRKDPPDIEVDGGIREENLREIIDAGANVIVSGTAVFRGNPEENAARMCSVLREYERRETEA